jgi:hypothetical protein
MMAVVVLERLPRHAEEAADFMDWDAPLRQPGGAGMPQGVRHHVVAEPGEPSRRTKTLADAFDRLAVPFDNVVPRNAESLPPSQMTQEPWRDPDRRLPFLGFALAGGAAIEHTAIQVDPSLAFGRFQRRAANGTGSRTGIEPDQDEARNVDERDEGVAGSNPATPTST